MPLQRAILAVQQISLLPLGQPFQTIVQFPARFLLLHNALRLHGVGVGCGFDAPQLLFSRQNIVQRNTLVTDTILVLRYHPLFKSGKGIPNHIHHSVADGRSRVGQELHVARRIELRHSFPQAQIACLFQIVRVKVQTGLCQIHATKKVICHLANLAVYLTLVGALREGEIVGLTPEDLDFDAADGIGTFRINKSMQRVRKEALNQVDDGCIIKVFPDKLERSTTSLILKSTKTASSCRTIFMTSALKEELKKWLNQLAADEMKDPARYHDSGMLFRLSNGLAIEPVLIRKKFLKWQDAHPEFPRIVFHGLRHSSATYQLMISGGDVKAVQGTTGHATADMLVNTYAHIQQSSRVELGRKFEEGFYAKQESPSPQAVPAAGEPTISMTALLELLKNADPEVKAQLRLALLT